MITTKIKCLTVITENIENLLECYEVGSADYNRLKDMYLVFVGILKVNETYHGAKTVEHFAGS